MIDRSEYDTPPTSSNAGLFRDGTRTGNTFYADFAQSLTPYNSNAQGSSGGTYTPEIDTGRELRKMLERDLRMAIENDEIGVVFQPIVSAETGEIVGVEALARWRHGEHGEVPPDKFIPIAEDSGLIVPLGRSVLTAACRQASDWEVDLAVNLSPAQFWGRGLAGPVSEVLAETRFPADRLELEITEGYRLRRPEAAGAIVGQLKAMGVRIALDDFGTGFASIGYLQRLGFDSIKIDRSFAAAAGSHAKAADLVCAIVSMGKALDLPVTAEGVELEAQATLMRKAGCIRLQGWVWTADPWTSDVGLVRRGPPGRRLARLRVLSAAWFPQCCQLDANSSPPSAICPAFGKSQAMTHNVILDFSRPRKPAGNAFAELFDGRVRAECLMAVTPLPTKQLIPFLTGSASSRLPQRRFEVPRSFA